MRGCARCLLLFSSMVMLLFFSSMGGGAAWAQKASIAAAGGALNSKVSRVEGVDAQSGIRYVRFSLLGPAMEDGKAPPRFTMECTESDGKRGVNLLVTFGGVGQTEFTPPVHVEKGKAKPPKNPDVKLTMDFEGWKDFTRAWEVLPSGELRYRNPGMHSPNLESTRVFLVYLNSLPELRIGYAKGSADPREEVFATQPLLDEMAKTPLCQR